jgi:magnesium-transporting ATPase (P-type)
VEYVLSDKTGTLTKNQMNLVKCTIGNQEYGGAAAPANQDEASSSSEHTAGLHDDLRLQQVLASGSEPAGIHPTATTAAQQFFRHLALSNGVTRSAVGGEETYQSTSPDEEALVTKAAQMGFVLWERTKDRVKIKVHGVEEAYTALGVLEFTSARKCMSVIVQRKDGTVLVLSKGADNVMLRKLRDSTDPRALERMQATLHRYATSGLRTLVLTSRALGQSEFASWNERYVQTLKPPDPKP